MLVCWTQNEKREHTEKGGGASRNTSGPKAHYGNGCRRPARAYLKRQEVKSHSIAER